MTGQLLRLARCRLCGGYSFPENVPGCRVCGAPPERLEATPAPQPPRLLNYVTVNSELAPGLPVPCVIGEIELAPGIVEEALIDGDASGLALGMPLVAVARAGEGGAPARWVFMPAAAERS